jgi:diketogulonate reductase-like aldo/keto reductase
MPTVDASDLRKAVCAFLLPAALFDHVRCHAFQENVMSAPLVIANGAAIPAIGLGTFKSDGEDGVKAVQAALAAGYRHIDTAVRYGNEAEVGEGLRTGGVPRDQIFVTTKVWWDEIADGALQASAEAILKRLGLAQVDLLLIHWPNPAVPLKASIKALCEAKTRGLTRHIGVSNFPVALLDEAVALASEPLVANQCEYHPMLDQSKVIAACRKHGMAFTSYCPIGRGAIDKEPVIAAIATRHNKSAAQVVLRWHTQQQGVVAIPKSANPGRIAENLAIFDFTLTPDEMAAIHGLARPDGRLIKPDFQPQWDKAA